MKFKTEKPIEKYQWSKKLNKTDKSLARKTGRQRGVRSSGQGLPVSGMKEEN